MPNFHQAARPKPFPRPPAIPTAPTPWQRVRLAISRRAFALVAPYMGELIRRLNAAEAAHRDAQGAAKKLAGRAASLNAIADRACGAAVSAQTDAQQLRAALAADRAEREAALERAEKAAERAEAAETRAATLRAVPAKPSPAAAVQDIEAGYRSMAQAERERERDALERQAMLERHDISDYPTNADQERR